MEPEARYTVVGASVLLLVIVIAAAAAWMFASGNARAVRHYTLLFAQQSVEGLVPDGEVRLKGIHVGSVTRIGFSQQQAGSVEVDVDVDASAPVRESSRAAVDRNLVTGVAAIQLVTLDEASPLLRAPAGSTVAVIPEGETKLQQFSQTVERLAQRADETLRQVETALSPRNQAAFAETLENLRLASRSAPALASGATGTLASVRHAADGLQDAARGAGEDFHRLADRYDTLGAQAGASVQEASETVRQVGADVSRLAGRAEDFLGGAGLELHLTGEQVRNTAEALDMSARKVGDPRALLFGPAKASLGPGEALQ
jgi:phospholipid/cholesterol/gamma-HCH transport system substrate-binding protein